jgi:hypothetical protein
MKLHEIRLPAGEQRGIDIGAVMQNGSRYLDPQAWLSQGFSGVRFIGQGRGITRLIPAPGVWINWFIEQHPGVVRFESLSIHGRGQSAIQAGREHPARVVKKFRVELADFELIADPPSPGAYDGGRVGWGLFTTQCNVHASDGDIYWNAGREHPFYLHHQAGPAGATFKRLRFHESPGECIKNRYDTDEALWAGKEAKLVVSGCRFNWKVEPWSSRGAAGITMQGAGCDALIEGNEFWASPGPSNTRALMLDDNYNDGKPQFYDPLTGAVGRGHANGHILVRRNSFQAGPGTDNLTPVVRVGNLAPGPHRIARSFAFTENAVYGRNLQLQLVNVPGLVVKDNNTERAMNYARSIGMDVTHECVVPGQHAVVPLSRYRAGVAP